MSSWGLLLFVVLSCGYGNKPENCIVADAMTTLRQDLPIQLAGIGKVREIDYEGKSVIFQMKIKEDDTYGVNIGKINEKVRLAKQIVSAQIGMMTDKQKNAMRDIAEQSFGLKVIINGTNSNRGEIELLPEEIKSSLVNAANRTPDDFSLEMIALTTKIMLPVQVDQVTIWSDTQMTESAFVYVYKLKDYDIDISRIDLNMFKKEKTDILRQNMDVMGNVVRLCKSTHRNLVYRYIGNSSNKSIDVVITPSDLGKI